MVQRALRRMERPLAAAGHQLAGDAPCWCSATPHMRSASVVGGRLHGVGSRATCGVWPGVRLPRHLRPTFVLIASIGFYFSSEPGIERGIFAGQPPGSVVGGRHQHVRHGGERHHLHGGAGASFPNQPRVGFSGVATLVPAYFVNAYYIFPLLRRMNITSTYEYLERRFNVPSEADRQRAVRAAANLSAGASIVLVLPALAISAVTGINVYASVIGMGVVTTIYTSLGGFQAVIWTEVFQGILKFIAPLVMIGFCRRLAAGRRAASSSRAESGNGKFELRAAHLGCDRARRVDSAGELSCSSSRSTRRATSRSSSACFPRRRKRCGACRRWKPPAGCSSAPIANLSWHCHFLLFPGAPRSSSTPPAQTDQIVPLFTIQAMPVGFAGT